MPLLMVAGHQRSGTSIMRILLNSHPEIAVTHEFANLKNIRRSRWYYSMYILRRMMELQARGNEFALFRNDHTSLMENLLFMGRYLVRIQWNRSRVFGFQGAESALHSLFPKRKWVGDKFPDYIWNLKHYASSGKVTCIVMYRDGRDVASSTLVSVRTMWKNRKFIRILDNPEKIANRWVRSIELMERCAGKVIPVRYERLISEPKAVMGEIGSALGVNPEYFPTHLLRPTSVGKHHSLLTDQELGIVQAIAGPTLARLGYS
jgi:hypothetical protein